MSGESCYTSPPGIEVLSNASSFAVFVAVRNSILEKHNHIASELNPTTNCTSSPPPEFSDTIDSDSDDEDKISSTQSLPKVNKDESFDKIRRLLFGKCYFKR